MLNYFEIWIDTYPFADNGIDQTSGICGKPQSTLPYVYQTYAFADCVLLRGFDYL